MRKTIRIFLLVLVVTFIVAQFYRPEKNTSEASENNILMLHSVPDEVAGLLKNSCFDCHSNNTTYRWYHNISPVSWMVADHIREGKKELNFSEWGNMDIFSQITKLEEMCQESEHRKMPLKSYLLMHSKAKLSDEQIATLCDWTTRLSEELLVKAAEE
ncbi:heme-binding domain-containing protein [Maribellus sp. YY47]|uniref:heme-binding domain-containing protein n=1 Tax=Maribellus sp. YY47 TaxID=2929486 RepID=UPI002000B5AC|nr:heme-binding domain-containing protein [Maribellus sp. YY47]MCK3684415.1 heme-binding domain-containing protein [Maribellus sp. YY47]